MYFIFLIKIIIKYSFAIVVTMNVEAAKTLDQRLWTKKLFF